MEEAGANNSCPKVRHLLVEVYHSKHAYSKRILAKLSYTNSIERAVFRS